MDRLIRRQLCVALVALTGCFFLPSQSIGAPEKALKKVKYHETARSVSYAASYVAVAKGFFTQEGLDVDLQTTLGSDKVMAALLSGNADVALTGPEFPIYIWHGKSPLKVKIICSLVAKDPMLLVRRGQSADGFKWSDLKQKSVLGWRQGSTPTMFLDAALRNNSLDPVADVKVNDNVGVAARYGAFIANVAEYGIFFEPDASRLQREGHGKIVASIGEEVGAVDFTLFSATDEFIKKHPDIVQAWANGIYRAQRWIKSSSKDQIADVLAPYFPGIAREDLLSSIERHLDKKLWNENPVVGPEFLRKFEDILIAGKSLQPNQYMKYEDLVDRRFADKAVETIR